MNTDFKYFFTQIIQHKYTLNFCRVYIVALYYNMRQTQMNFFDIQHNISAQLRYQLTLENEQQMPLQSTYILLRL